jgi:hypothetical protein
MKPGGPNVAICRSDSSGSGANKSRDQSRLAGGGFAIMKGNGEKGRQRGLRFPGATGDETQGESKVPMRTRRKMRNWHGLPIS